MIFKSFFSSIFLWTIGMRVYLPGIPVESYQTPANHRTLEGGQVDNTKTRSTRESPWNYTYMYVIIETEFVSKLPRYQKKNAQAVRKAVFSG